MRGFLRRFICLALAILFPLCLCACGEQAEEAKSITPQGKAYFTYFDTVSYVYSYAGDSAESFNSLSADISHILSEYNILFDIYHEYSGVNNLCTVNKNAGGAPLEVDEKLISFLLDAVELYNTTKGEMNIMLGSVLSLWHECREDGTRIPTEEELLEASGHTGISLLEIDEENCTVRIADEKASIDVGAFGKGYATEKAAEYLESAGAESYVLNVGGNIRIIGSKPDGSGWSTKIRDPFDEAGCAAALLLSNTSCVTSGIYERYFTVDGIKYHHIIDKDTLYPSAYYASVTVICKNSGLADALSTALFCMSSEEGSALAEKLGAEVLWIYPDGSKEYTPGLSELILEIN